MGYLQTLAKALTGDGLVLPAPVRSFLKGKPQPLALDTRERLADWCAAHGYSDEQRQSLHKLIRTLVTRDDYLRAVASGSSRIDLDGADTGPVSDIERESAAKRLAAIAAKRMKPKAAMAPPEPVPEPPPEPPPVASALQALASAVDAAITTPGKPIARAPVVEIRKRRPLSREVDVDRQPPKRSDASIIQPLPMAPPLPASVVRQEVERVNTRRNALRMIAIHLKAGNHAAIAAERSAWVAEASDALAAAGHDRDRAEKQVRRHGRRDADRRRATGGVALAGQWVVDDASMRFAPGSKLN